MLLQVISGFTIVGAFPLSDGKFIVGLLERSFVGEESGTPLAFLFGSFYKHSIGSSICPISS